MFKSSLVVSYAYIVNYYSCIISRAGKKEHLFE
jgi:hypothetical protein